MDFKTLLPHGGIYWDGRGHRFAWDGVEVQPLEFVEKVGGLKVERDELRSKLETATALNNVLVQQSHEIIQERDGALLQVDALKKALYAEVHGVSCGPDCAGGGYRGCMECDAKVKAALNGAPYKPCETKRHDVCGTSMEFAGGLGWVCPKCDRVTEKRPGEAPVLQFKSCPHTSSDTPCRLCEVEAVIRERDEALRKLESVRQAMVASDKVFAESVESEKIVRINLNRIMNERDAAKLQLVEVYERCAKVADDFMLAEGSHAYAAGGQFSMERNSNCAEIAVRIRALRGERNHAHEWVGAAPCPRCSYLMRKSGPCTKCGYVEKQADACQHEPVKFCEEVVIGDADRERCGMAIPCQVHGGRRSCAEEWVDRP